MKRKHWLGILWLLALLLLLGGCRKAEVEDPALPMDLPLEAEENGLPRDWEISVYGEDYEAVCEDGALRLTLEEGDDLRLTHLVQVSPESRYILSALIRTRNVEEGRGATLSIDNYSLDKSCVYSESLYGDNDWTPVFLYFETQAGQTQVNLALRLGGYSENSTGTAWFREVRGPFVGGGADGHRAAVLRIPEPGALGSAGSAGKHLQAHLWVDPAAGAAAASGAVSGVQGP